MKQPKKGVTGEPPVPPPSLQGSGFLVHKAQAVSCVFVSPQRKKKAEEMLVEIEAYFMKD